MNFNHISAEDWQTFREKYASAHSFLQGAANRGEEAALRAELSHSPEYRRKAWIQTRLEDIERVRAAFWALNGEQVTP